MQRGSLGDGPAGADSVFTKVGVRTGQPGQQISQPTQVELAKLKLFHGLPLNSNERCGKWE